MRANGGNSPHEVGQGGEIDRKERGVTEIEVMGGGLLSDHYTNNNEFWLDS